MDLFGHLLIPFFWKTCLFPRCREYFNIGFRVLSWSVCKNFSAILCFIAFAKKGWLSESKLKSFWQNPGYRLCSARYLCPWRKFLQVSNCICPAGTVIAVGIGAISGEGYGFVTTDVADESMYFQSCRVQYGGDTITMEGNVTTETGVQFSLRNKFVWKSGK